MTLTPKAQEKLTQSTILVAGVDAPIIRCKARQSFTHNGVNVAAGDQFFLVRSSKDATRYYVVAFSNYRHDWQCSCGAGAKKHAHTNEAKAWVIEHVVKPREAVIMSSGVSATPVGVTKLPRASEVVAKQITTSAQPDVIRGNLHGQRGFSLMR